VLSAAGWVSFKVLALSRVCGMASFPPIMRLGKKSNRYLCHNNSVGRILLSYILTFVVHQGRIKTLQALVPFRAARPETKHRPLFSLENYRPWQSLRPPSQEAQNLARLTLVDLDLLTQSEALHGRLKDSRQTGTGLLIPTKVFIDMILNLNGSLKRRKGL
jgi:hypothetical protein